MPARADRGRCAPLRACLANTRVRPECTVLPAAHSRRLRRPRTRGARARPARKQIGDFSGTLLAMFTIDVVTLFPELFAPFVGLSIVGRAVERGLANVRYHHLLDELVGEERADDAPFGGGPGMVLRIEPIARILDAITRDAGAERRVIVVPSAGGARFV